MISKSRFTHKYTLSSNPKSKQFIWNLYLDNQSMICRKLLQTQKLACPSVSDITHASSYSTLINMFTFRCDKV